MYIYCDFIPFIHLDGIEELANEQSAKVSLSLLDFTENHELTFRIGKSHKRLSIGGVQYTVHILNKKKRNATIIFLSVLNKL